MAMPRGQPDDPDTWFKPRNYPHFDKPVAKREVAEEVVKRFFERPEQHRFLPLISFTKRTRRWRSKRKVDASAPARAKETWKPRELAYSSNRDAHIFAAVGWELAQRYEQVLVAAGLDDVVVAYRKGRSNVTTAKSAFLDVQRMGVCTTITLDIKNFFPTISHAVLKRCWCQVMGSTLPPAHFAVFKAITQYSTVDRSKCLRRLGLSTTLPSRKLPRPLCTREEFARFVRGRAPHGLVEVRRAGIPQGTPISAVAANVAMLDFDVAVNEEAKRRGCTYRRYSDDMLLVCPCEEADGMLGFLVEALRDHAGCLQISADKTRRVEFEAGKLPANVPHLLYLGFAFNGDRAILRSATVSKFYGRMRRAVAALKRRLREGQFSGSAKGGRSVLQRRKLVSDFSRYGEDSLIRTYVRSATRIFPGKHIPRQFRNHLRRLRKLTKQD
jgi:hypothetical protein